MFGLELPIFKLGQCFFLEWRPPCVKLEAFLFFWIGDIYI